MSDDLVDEMLAHARLTRAQRARVRGELVAHIEDALAAGKNIDEIQRSLGDANVLAAALEISPPTVRRSRALTAGLAASVATLAWYLATAVRLGSFATSSTPNAVIDSTASTARLFMAADAALDQLNVDRAMEIATDLAASNSAFGRFAAIRVAQRALPTVAAEPCTPTLQRVVALANAPIPNLDAWFGAAVSQSPGAPMSRALRVVQAMKGVRSPSLSGRLLEPFYFATASAPTDVWRPAIIKAERHTEPSRCAVPLTLDP